MDQQTFDALVRRIGKQNRRSAMKTLLGLAGGVAVGVVTHGAGEAARRGYSGPTSSNVSSNETYYICGPNEYCCGFWYSRNQARFYHNCINGYTSHAVCEERFQLNCCDYCARQAVFHP